jgi:hypothetical protein
LRSWRKKKFHAKTQSSQRESSRFDHIRLKDYISRSRMKLISETTGLEKLKEIQKEFAEEIRAGYEHKARSCLVCKTPGACCLDEHFVNVRISRLEAVAINRVIASLPRDKQRLVERRISATIEKYKLDEAIDVATTYSCPLFESGVGCLVHDKAKPLPCIAHACYENEKDLPPDELLDEREIAVEKLNQKVYGKREPWLPLPVAISQKRLR